MTNSNEESRIRIKWYEDVKQETFISMRFRMMMV
jgi:hypothetical protein